MNVLSFFQPIKLFVFDVDGVLTDGSILVLDDGQWARRMNIKDGYALQLAKKKGYDIVVISGGHSEAVVNRLGKLGIEDVHTKVEDKAVLLRDYAERLNLKQEEILYMGDDIPDIEALQFAGLPCCPADAVAEVKMLSKYISISKGGEGCVRDVIEKTLKLRNDWVIDQHIRSQ